MKAILFTVMTTLLAFNAHAESVSLICNYPDYSNPDGIKHEQKFNLKFMYDTITGKAVVVGNNGVEDVIIVKGAMAISFIETLPTGAVQTTTITNEGSSVHSRHSVMGEKIIPSQYYGKCEIQ